MGDGGRWGSAYILAGMGRMERCVWAEAGNEGRLFVEGKN